MRYYANLLRDKPLSELVEKIGSIDFQDPDDAGETPLVAAVNLDRMDLVELMVSSGADVRKASFLTSPIGAAISSSKPNAYAILRYLVDRHGFFSEQESPMHYCGELNEPMLHAAVRRKKSDVVRLLIANGYNANWMDTDGVSAWSLAETIDEEIAKVVADEMLKKGIKKVVDATESGLELPDQS